MALLFCDGFEAMNTDSLLTRWSSNSDADNSGETKVQSTTVRSGSNAMQLRDSASVHVSKNFPEALATFIVGWAVYYADDISTASGVQFLNASYSNLTVKPESDGTITVRRGDSTGTILGTSSPVLTPDAWKYIEFKATIGNSPSGSFELRVEGDPVLSGEAIDTLNGGTVNCTYVKFNSNFSETYLDDVYILDTTGGVNDDFLGPQRVDTILPNAAGAYSQWNALSGENWANVADTSGDEDATYVQTMSGEVMDTYLFGDLTALSVDNIAGVMIFASARRTADTPEKLDTVCRIGSTNYSGEMKYLPMGYYGITQVWDVNPADSAQWEEADVNGAQFGIKKIDN